MESMCWFQQTTSANNIVVVWRLHYINTLKQKLSGSKAYKEVSEEEKSVVNGHCNHLALKFSVCVKERQDRLPTMYWLPKLHKRPYKARFIANSSSCTKIELSKLLTSCLTAVKNHVIRYCEKVYERSGKNLFWSINNSGEVLNKLKSRGFRATSLSTYDFSTLYTTLPDNLIKDFSDQFKKIIVRYKRIGYNINIMRQSLCLVFNPITVNNFASLFNCTPVGRASDSMMAPT